MNLQELKYIVELNRVRHFGRAAERCFVSQPTLSVQLKKLESELGVVLFERSKNQVIPTQVGSQIIDKAKSILSLVADVTELAQTDPWIGTIKLGVIPTISPYFLPWVMPQWITQFPQMKFVVIEEKTEVLTAALESGDLDFCIAAHPLPNSAFEFLKIERDPFFLVVPPIHSLANRQSVSIEDIPSDLLLLEEGHCLRDQALAFCNRPSFQESDYRGTSLETLKYMVASGLGCTLMPRMSLKTVSSEIVAIPFKSPAPFRTIAGFWRKTSVRQEIIIQSLKLIMSG